MSTLEILAEADEYALTSNGRIVKMAHDTISCCEPNEIPPEIKEVLIGQITDEDRAKLESLCI